jgi:hypothetical protein
MMSMHCQEQRIAGAGSAVFSLPAAPPRPYNSPLFPYLVADCRDWIAAVFYVFGQIEGAIPMRLHVSLLTSVLVCGLGLAGCRNIATPTLAPQGDTAYQQYNAQRFDPLPEPDTAPEIVGARGREYEKPISLPSRARWDPRTWVRRFGF